MEYSKLRVLLVKAQTAQGTPETALVNTDFVAVDQGFKLDVMPEMYKPELARNIFGNEPNIPGKIPAAIECSFDVSCTGSTTAPMMSKFLLASGYSEAVATNKRTYTPLHTRTGMGDITAWSYSGDKTTGQCALVKCANIMGSLSLDGKNGLPLKAKFAGKGAQSAAPSMTDYIATALSLQAGTKYPVMSASTVSLMGYTTPLVSAFSFDQAAGVVLQDNISATYGIDGAHISGYSAKCKITFYANGTDNVLSTLQAGTLSTMQITFGPAGSRFTLKSGTSKFQIEAVEIGEADGLGIYNIDGTFVDNDHTIILNDA
jgi:hypothetical protein